MLIISQEKRVKMLEKVLLKEQKHENEQEIDKRKRKKEKQEDSEAFYKVFFFLQRASFSFFLSPTVSI